MTLLRNAHTLPASTLSDNARISWRQQCSHVAKSSEFYRRLWDGKQPPCDLNDLPDLPLSDKSHLRVSQADHPPFGNYLAAPQARAVRLHRTSGTTGQAMNLALSERDCEITETVGGRAQRLAGLTPDDTVAHCLNYQMWMGGLTDHMTLQKTGALVIPFGVGSTELLIRTIQEVGVTALSCTPSYPAVLERVIADRFPDLSPKDLGLRLGLFGGEAGLDDPAWRTRMTQTWGLEPRNANYGVSDVFSNFAAQCEYDTRLHFVAADVLYPELIDPETTQPRPIAPGVTGELVLTHLERECQPLVRFRTGDIIAVDATDPCQCGCTGFRFRVVGRSDDMIVVRGLNMFPTMVAAVINGFSDLNGDYRIILDQPPPFDVLPVHVELADNVTPSVALAQAIENRFKQVLGVTARLTLLSPGTFGVTEGKTSRVIRSFS
ncbi:AMP-binding protein (plasmid) [Aliisedimentitalea scapharcae]|uniref:AMP-binding protein n=1 Tax=Aliisedimentitalea scapharcae TaxID=1524259 RepID=A0ABZ2XYN2_9RHOB